MICSLRIIKHPLDVWLAFLAVNGHFDLGVVTCTDLAFSEVAPRDQDIVVDLGRQLVRRAHDVLFEQVAIEVILILLLRLHRENRLIIQINDFGSQVLL